MYVDQRIAGLHVVTLFHIELHHPAREFSGNADTCSIGLTFDQFGRFLQETEPDDCNCDNSDSNDEHGCHQCAAFFFLGYLRARYIIFSHSF